MIPEDTPIGLDNCGIVSVATLANVPYKDAERVFIDTCKKHSLTSVWDRLEVMKQLELPILFEEYYRPKPTLSLWLKDNYNPRVNYSVTLTGHVITLKGGLLLDQVYRLGVVPERSTYTRKRVQCCIGVLSGIHC